MVFVSRMRGCLVMCAIVLTACGSVRSVPVAGDDGGLGSTDDGGGKPDAAQCFGTGIVRVCAATAPSQSFLISAPTIIDTAQALACTPVTGGDGYCVVVATDMVVSAQLRATGPKPLVLVASGSITVTPSGSIDVGSRRGVTPELGAGADPATCSAGTPPTATATTGGGGAGGSFIGPGGHGASGASSSAGGAPAAVVTTIAELRGGCPGQPGAPSTSSSPGHGGGAVYLIAGATIDVEGVINAAGEGGAGGNPVAMSPMDLGSGGGGGGAGGMIGLDAPAIGNSGTILASGGGGGGGAGSRSSYLGTAGVDPSTTIAAAGGDGARNSFGTRVGGIGGRGAARLTGADDGIAGTNDSVDIGGGGGGGGGAGLIKAPATADLGTNVAPAPTP